MIVKSGSACGSAAGEAVSKHCSSPHYARGAAAQSRRRGQGWSAPEGLRDRGAKRIRSVYGLLDVRQASPTL